MLALCVHRYDTVGRCTQDQRHLIDGGESITVDLTVVDDAGNEETATETIAVNDKDGGDGSEDSGGFDEDDETDDEIEDTDDGDGTSGFDFVASAVALIAATILALRQQG